MHVFQLYEQTILKKKKKDLKMAKMLQDRKKSNCVFWNLLPLTGWLTILRS